MKWLLPAIIIGLVGGYLDAHTELHKVWCFLIGVGFFALYVFIKSVITTMRVMKQTKGAKAIKIDQHNRGIKSE